MKQSQIIIKEDNEPDYTRIGDNIRERLLSYKSHEQQWALTELRKGENIESIIDGLEYYREKIKDNRYQQIMKIITSPINPKSLTQITLQQIKAGQQQYDTKYGSVSKREAKKILKKSYAKKLIDEPYLKLIKIERTDDTDGAAKTLAQYAMNTKWCITDLKMGECYLNKGPIYYIEHEGNRYLCHIESEQLMNVKDQPYRIGIELYHRMIKYIKEIGIFLEDKTLPEYMGAIKYSPKHAYEYARDVIKGRWPEAEPYIMKDSHNAYWYARDVIKGRWPEAEPYIMKNPEYAYVYARDVIKGRWPEAEPYIIKEPNLALNYAEHVIGGRWPEAEQCIAGRWMHPDDPSYASFLAYVYAHYAIDIIKGRWPEAEPYIKQNNDAWNVYKWSSRLR